jgi:hypothetical protein
VINCPCLGLRGGEASNQKKKKFLLQGGKMKKMPSTYLCPQCVYYVHTNTKTPFDYLPGFYKNTFLDLFIYLFILVVLGIKPKSWHMLSSVTELNHQH